MLEIYPSIFKWIEKSWRPCFLFNWFMQSSNNKVYIFYLFICLIMRIELIIRGKVCKTIVQWQMPNLLDHIISVFRNVYENWSEDNNYNKAKDKTARNCFIFISKKTVMNLFCQNENQDTLLKCDFMCHKGERIVDQKIMMLFSAAFWSYSTHVTIWLISLIVYLNWMIYKAARNLHEL